MLIVTELSNGIKLLMEPMQSVRSVSLGIWVRTGSRYEPVELNGISHFLEHMVFKGTVKRSARQIAMDIDSLGGELNAFTSKEVTTFYIKVLDEFLDRGIELLSDLFVNSVFPEDEIEREKGVVLEEISMVDDTPDDLVHDIFAESIWGTSGLGQTILGRRESVESFTQAHIIDYVKQRYVPSNIIVSCSGNFDPQVVGPLVEKALGGLSGTGAVPDIVEPQGFAPSMVLRNKDLSEAHICIGIKGIPQNSPDRYSVLLLNTILGGGISSRLFQEIREKRGLVYTVYSFLSSYLDTGHWGIYAGTSREKTAEVLAVATDEMRRMGGTIDADELDRAKAQLKGNIMLGLESTSRRMQNIANQQIYYGRNFTPQEVIESIDGVSVDEVNGAAHRYIASAEMACTVLGPVEGLELKL